MPQELHHPVPDLIDFFLIFWEIRSVFFGKEKSFPFVKCMFGVDAINECVEDVELRYIVLHQQQVFQSFYFKQDVLLVRSNFIVRTLFQQLQNLTTPVSVYYVLLENVLEGLRSPGFLRRLLLYDVRYCYERLVDFDDSVASLGNVFEFDADGHVEVIRPPSVGVPI